MLHAQTKCLKGLNSEPAAVPLDALPESRTMAIHPEISDFCFCFFFFGVFVNYFDTAKLLGYNGSNFTATQGVSWMK